MVTKAWSGVTADGMPPRLLKLSATRSQPSPKAHPRPASAVMARPSLVFMTDQSGRHPNIMRATRTARASQSRDSARVFASAAADRPTAESGPRTFARLAEFSRTTERLRKSDAVVAISSEFGLIEPERNRTIGVRATTHPMRGHWGFFILRAAANAMVRKTAEIRPLTIRMA